MIYTKNRERNQDEENFGINIVINISLIITYINFLPMQIIVVVNDCKSIRQ